MDDRYEELDSLRGLAAISVFFGHIFLIFNDSFIGNFLFKFGPLRFLIAGSEAVIMFFVLSGFVLSLSFYSSRMVSYRLFVIKRFCRIYIPYMTAIIIAFTLREMVYSGKIEGLSDWFNANWLESLNQDSLLNHSLLIKTFTSNINNVVWSLVHEMRISLAFPLIMFILIRLSFTTGILMGIVLSGGSLIYSYVLGAPFVGTELYVTFHYAAMFVIGAIIARYRDDINKRVSYMSLTQKSILFLSAVILYLYVHPSFILNIIVPNFNPFYRMVIDSWVISLGAGLLIVSAFSFNFFSNLLKNRYVNYIGKISYSLYLNHLAILFSCFHLLNKSMPIWSISLIALGSTLIIASLMYYLVEKPSIKLGRFLTKPNSDLYGVLNKTN